MITKAQVQFIRSLEQKKVRDETGLFLVEGDKMVGEALKLTADSSFKPVMICGTDEWLKSNLHEAGDLNAEIIHISGHELERISLLKTPNQVLAILSHSDKTPRTFNYSKDLLIGLDRVQDPGNVGTLIRLADWFGLAGVIASPDSADFFSPKAVQSTMGSIFRVPLITMDLAAFLKTLPADFTVYGTHLNGTNLYRAPLTVNGLILMGNESKGLSPALTKHIQKNLLIPDFSGKSEKPESLNVSIAAAVVCSEFRRRETC